MFFVQMREFSCLARLSKTPFVTPSPIKDGIKLFLDKQSVELTNYQASIRNAQVQ
jgi:hypothetical protein